MAFTFYSPPTLTAQQVSPFANLVSNALQSYQNAVTSKYTPRMLESEIFKNQFGPLAELATSPLGYAMLPDQQQQLAGLISQLVQRSSGSMGGTGGSIPGLGGSSSQGTGGSSGMSMPGGPPPMPGEVQNLGDQVTSGNPNLPSGDLGNAIREKTFAGYRGQLYGPGQLYPTPGGGQAVTPEATTVAHAQQQENNIDAFKKLAPDLISEGKEFLQPGAISKLNKSHIGAVLDRLGVSGISKAVTDDPDMAGRYNNYMGDVSRASDILRLIFPTANTEGLFNKYNDMLKAKPNDTEKTYNARIQKVMSDLETKILPIAKKAMGSEGGYNLTPQLPGGHTMTELNAGPQGANQPQKQPADTVIMISPKGKRVPVHTSQIQNALKRGLRAA